MLLPYPFRRLTSSPRIRLGSVAHLLAVVCAIECNEHQKRAIVQQVMNGRIAYATCCQQHLDLIEKTLLQLPLVLSQPVVLHKGT